MIWLSRLKSILRCTIKWYSILRVVLYRVSVVIHVDWVSKVIIKCCIVIIPCVVVILISITWYG